MEFTWSCILTGVGPVDEGDEGDEGRGYEGGWRVVSSTGVEGSPNEPE